MIEPLSSAAESRPPYDQAIEARALSRRYGLRWALLDVGFVLPRGCTLLLAGHNGSGKTTLLRILATAIRADRGEARICGFELRDMDAIRSRVALLSHASYLYEALSAFENLSVAARSSGRDSGSAALTKLLDYVGLGRRAGDPVSSFSAGMRKRLSLARLLLQRPELLLLDEPYGALDPSGFSLVDEIVTEARLRGATVVMATHQLERGAGLADFALLLEQGKTRWSGPASEVVQAVGTRRFELMEGGA